MTPSITMNQGQSVQVTATPEDSNGNPGSLTTTIPTWNPSDPSVVVTPAANGLTASVKAPAKPGTFTVTVTGQGIPSGPNFNSPFNVIVNPNPASQFAFAFGTPA